MNFGDFILHVEAELSFGFNGGTREFSDTLEQLRDSVMGLDVCYFNCRPNVFILRSSMSFDVHTSFHFRCIQHVSVVVLLFLSEI